MESWGRGHFTDSDATIAGLKNAAAIGGIKVIDQVLDLIEGFKGKGN